MKKLNIAISSLTHAHVRKYYQTLTENTRLNWVAVSCSDKEVKENFLHFGHDIPCFDSLEEMLEKHKEIEAVIVASENKKHFGEFKTCIEYGKHILSMKIPTFDMTEYDELITLVDKNNIICQVELELHYNPCIRRVKELIANNIIGDIISFNATNITLSPVWAFPWQGVPELSYGEKVVLKKGNPRFRGGALSDHPHIFDLVRWISNDDYNYIYSEVCNNIRKDIEVEDCLFVTGKMKKGLAFMLDPSWSRMEERIKRPGPGWEVFPKRMEVNFTIIGTNGLIQADAFGPNIYHSGGPNNRYTVQYTYFDEWVGLMDEFYDAVKRHVQPKINLKWHRCTIEAMNKCYESIALEKPVYF